MIPFTVPALRERIEDIPSLARHFLADSPRLMAANQKISAMPLWGFCPIHLARQRPRASQPDRAAHDHLPPFPHRAAASPPELFRDLPAISSRPNATLQEARSAYEREFILRKLSENQWNMTRTATALGLERSHLYRKMKSLGISAEE